MSATTELPVEREPLGDSGDITVDEKLIRRKLDTFDLVVQGATIRQVAERHGIHYSEARQDYLDAIAMLNERTMESVAAMRDEITARQRTLILANMPRARAGDDKAANIVQRADNLLVGLWGLRTARLDVTVKRSDTLDDALSAYLQGVADKIIGR